MKFQNLSWIFLRENKQFYSDHETVIILWIVQAMRNRTMLQAKFV